MVIAGRTWNAIALMLALALGGCASLTPQQCATVDWRQLGHGDGARGLSPQLGRHTRACARAGIAPDAQRYAQGHAAGRATYCTPQSVLGLAIQGAGTPAICPVEQQAGLQPYYRAGLDAHDATRAFERLARERDAASFELRHRDPAPERRQALVQRLDALERELGLASYERQAAEHRLLQYQRLLAR